MVTMFSQIILEFQLKYHSTRRTGGLENSKFHLYVIRRTGGFCRVETLHYNVLYLLHHTFSTITVFYGNSSYT